jgi:hypothetical protein
LSNHIGGVLSSQENVKKSNYNVECDRRKLNKQLTRSHTHPVIYLQTRKKTEIVREGHLLFEIYSSRAYHPREQRALVSASAVATPGICSSAPDPRPRFALSPPDGSHNYPNGQLSAELNGSKKRKHFHYFELLIGSPTKFKYITINFVFGFQLCLRNAEREKYKEKNMYIYQESCVGIFPVVIGGKFST